MYLALFFLLPWPIAYATSKQILKVRVEDVMSRDIQFITPDITLTEAAQIMREKDIRHLPVFDGESVIFMLSMRDIAFVDLPE